MGKAPWALCVINRFRNELDDVCEMRTVIAKHDGNVFIVVHEILTIIIREIVVY